MNLDDVLKEFPEIRVYKTGKHRHRILYKAKMDDGVVVSGNNLEGLIVILRRDLKRFGAQQ